MWLKCQMTKEEKEMPFLCVDSWLRRGVIREMTSLALASVRIPMVKLETHLLPIQFLERQKPRSRAVFARCKI